MRESERVSERNREISRGERERGREGEKGVITNAVILYTIIVNLLLQ